MTDDPNAAAVEAYALGTLEADERARLDAHLPGCASCTRALAESREALARMAQSEGEVPPDPGLREHVLELAGAPREPLDLDGYDWTEMLPGIMKHVLSEDPERGVQTVLVRASPGARIPSHRHLGDEEILVLRGRLRDHRGEYGPGQVCRSRAGSVHAEDVMPGEECVCFVVYHGGHEPVTE